MESVSYMSETDRQTREQGIKTWFEYTISFCSVKTISWNFFLTLETEKRELG